MSRYRSPAPAPGATPVRFIPELTSSQRHAFVPAPAAALAIARITSSESTMALKTVPGNARCSAKNRGIAGPTGCIASNTSGAPAAAAISVSAIVEHLKRRMPCFSCSFTISPVLCVFTCGRSRPASPATAIIRRMFSSMRSG